MKIESRKYQGYIWYSDQRAPVLLAGDNEWGCEKNEQDNHFIVEGQLWDEDTRTSISIKYVDGKYLVSTYQLGEKYDLVEYVPRNMPGVSRLQFARCWRSVADENCNNFETQVLDRVVFMGLKMKEDKQ